MPTSLLSWLFFGFFFIGAAGGWFILAILGAEIWKAIQNQE